MDYRALKPGGTIAVVAPSGPLPAERLLGGVEALRSAGYAVEVMPHVGGAPCGVFSASDDERASDLAEALSRPDVDVVWCARGGYGAMRTLMALDAHGGWRRVFAGTDKMVVGFSDITALHAAAAAVGGRGVLGPMLRHLSAHGLARPDVGQTLRLLSGGRAEVRCVPMEGSVGGRARGRLVGGNLSIVYSLLSTPIAPSPDGCILFIEDLAEYRYHIDRIMQSLRFSGFLSRLSGVVVGQMLDMKDGATPFGADAYQVVARAVAGYGYPVLLGYPSGHDADVNFPVLVGGDAVLTVAEGEASLVMPAAGC